MGNDIYKENQRLKAEIDRLQAMMDRRKTEIDREADGEFLMMCVLSFFKGNSHIVVEERSGSKHIYFQA